MTALQGKHLHFDCASGIAGDMCMGALIDVGVPAEVIREAVAAVGLGRDRLRVEAAVKSGIASTNVWVRCEEGQTESHGHSAEHAQPHEHHHYAEIRERIVSSSLAPGVIALSLKIFDAVARAEAKMHGTTVSQVAFHEVGAVDSIVDVVGCAAALHWLNPASVSSSPVAMGKGTVRCAHGILPVPSPAAVEILREARAPISDGGLSIELCTPTGAAILAAVVTEWGAMPEMTPEFIGYGAGDLDLVDRPNVVRAMLGQRAQRPQLSGDTVVEIAANIDDMSSELCEYAAEQLMGAGALDVWWTGITMKKGRPALLLGVLCPEIAKEAVTETIFRETTSIGVRYRHMERTILERDVCAVETEFGSVDVKIGRYGDTVVNVAPEYENCRSLATAHGVPLKQVFAAAIAASSKLPR